MRSVPFDRRSVEALLTEVVRIGAPTFQEKRRSDFILSWIRKNVAAPCGQDSLGNVWVDLSHGQDSLVLFDAHIDTVFPDEEISIITRGNRLHAPGIFDNTIACVFLLLWAKQEAASGPCPFFLSFTVGEEGEGNLCGINKIIDDHGSRVSLACVLDLSMEAVSTTAVGSIRYELLWKTHGGHSWNDFGAPNAIHGLTAWAATLAAAFPWEKGLCSYNIGTVSGGTGINVIASEARARLDVRSIRPEFLSGFRHWMDAGPQTSAPSVLRILGERPAGNLKNADVLLSRIKQLHDDLHIGFSNLAYSTNANALLNSGLPAITTGIAVGNHVHTREEYLDGDSLEIGWEKLNRLAAILCETRNPSLRTGLSQAL